jgi:hypothetical protein
MQPSPAHVRFWNWFRDNGDRLAVILVGPDENAREAAMEELSDAARQVVDGPVLEVCAADAHGTKTLVVSADGKHDMVDAVKDFVAAAPSIAGWDVVAFRARDDVSSFEIGIQGERISADDVFFVVRDSESGLQVVLYVRGLTPKNRKIRGLGATLLAQHAVGELDTLTLLDSLELEPLVEPPGKELRPVKELAAVFDTAKAVRYPPPGAMVEPEDVWLNLSGTLQGSLTLVMLHSALRPLAGHPAYDYRLTVSIPYKARSDGMPDTDEEYQNACALGDRIADALQKGQQSLLALTLMTQGRRDLVFYTARAGAALLRLEDERKASPQARFKSSLERDTFWGLFRTFLDASEQADEEG